jgi:arginase family enzyme
LLHLDDALDPQALLAARCDHAGGLRADLQLLGPQLRLWGGHEVLAAVESALRVHLPEAAGPLLAFIGSGDFHHVTPFLVARALLCTGRPLTIVHIDNHPDWVKFSRGLHCGSWAARAARMPGVDRVITLGVCSSDLRMARWKGADLSLIRDGRIILFPSGQDNAEGSFTIAGVSQPTMASLGEEGFLQRLIELLGAGDIYLTIDKDVLVPADAATNWDQGRMQLDYLRRIVGRIAGKGNVVGADVCGDVSRPRYGGKLSVRLLKRCEALLGQPRRLALGPEAQARNERANLALYDDLMAVAA